MTRFNSMVFEFIYIGASHEYKGVAQDLIDWYPLLKPGGIIAGHDYVTNDDGPLQHRHDWSLNYDGTRDPSGRAFKGAVDDFAAKHDLHISVSYRESHWNTWRRVNCTEIYERSRFTPCFPVPFRHGSTATRWQLQIRVPSECALDLN